MKENNKITITLLFSQKSTKFTSKELDTNRRFRKDISYAVTYKIYMMYIDL